MLHNLYSNVCICNFFTHILLKPIGCSLSFEFSNITSHFSSGALLFVAFLAAIGDAVFRRDVLHHVFELSGSKSNVFLAITTT